LEDARAAEAALIQNERVLHYAPEDLRKDFEAAKIAGSQKGGLLAICA
jgi:hypothetical protein